MMNTGRIGRAANWPWIGGILMVGLAAIGIAASAYGQTDPVSADVKKPFVRVSVVRSADDVGVSEAPSPNDVEPTVKAGDASAAVEVPAPIRITDLLQYVRVGRRTQASPPAGARTPLLKSPDGRISSDNAAREENDATLGMLLASSAGRFAPPTVMSLGNRGIVVAEPGEGANGEPGIWLTPYSLNGSHLDQGIAIFHSFSQGAYTRRPAVSRRSRNSEAAPGGLQRGFGGGAAPGSLQRGFPGGGTAPSDRNSNAAPEIFPGGGGSGIAPATPYQDSIER